MSYIKLLLLSCLPELRTFRKLRSFKNFSPRACNVCHLLRGLLSVQ